MVHAIDIVVMEREPTRGLLRLGTLMLVMQRLDLLPKRPLGLNDGNHKWSNPELRQLLRDKARDWTLLAWNPRRKRTDFKLDVGYEVGVVKRLGIDNMQVQRFNRITLNPTAMLCPHFSFRALLAISSPSSNSRIQFETDLEALQISSHCRSVYRLDICATISGVA